MNTFKISNEIFSLGLDAQELSVYAYLISLPSNRFTLDGAATICVKQSTIAERCGIRAVQTVSKVLLRLREMELVEPLGRSIKANRHKGTYSYAVKQLDLKKGYFFVDRHVFGMLNPRQMKIYLFICKSFSKSLNICWNSYNDISQQTGMKRELVIQTVNELEALHLIVKIRKRAEENKRMFVDNHYQMIFFINGRIRKGKKIARMLCRATALQGTSPLRNNHLQFKYSTLAENCQECFGNIFPVRGSP